MTPSPGCHLRRLSATLAITLALTLAAAVPASAQWTGVYTPIAHEGNVFQTDITTGPNGLTTVVWDGFAEPSQNLIQAAQMPSVGAPASANQRLSSTEENGMTHATAVDPAGNTFVVWPRTQVSGIMMRKLSSDGTSGPVLTLSNTTDWTSRPALAADSDGNAAAVWMTQTSGGTSSIELAYIDEAQQVEAPQSIVSAQSGVYLGDPLVKFDDAGNAVVAYTRHVSGTVTTETVTFAPNSGTSAPRVMATETSGDSVYLNSMDASGDGDVIVTSDRSRMIIEHFFPTYVQVSSEVVRLDAGSSAPQSLTLDVADYTASAPIVRFRSDESAVVMFRGASDGGAKLFVVQIDPSWNATSATDVSAGIGSLEHRKLEIGGDGIATVLWSEFDGEYYKLFTRQIAPDGSISPTTALAPDHHVEGLGLTVGVDGLVAVVYLRYLTSTMYVTHNVPAPLCADGEDSTSGGDAVALSLSCLSATDQTLAIVESASSGELALDGAEHEATYTPDPGFEGRDQFTFKSTNAYGDSETKTFEVSVTDNATAAPPTAEPPAAAPAKLSVSRLDLSRSFLRRSRAARRAVGVSFTLSAAANVRIVVSRRFGRSTRGACLPFNRLRPPSRRCRISRTAFKVDAGNLTAGHQKVTLSAKNIRRKLRSGSYLVSVEANDGTQSSLAMRELRVNWKRDRSR